MGGTTKRTPDRRRGPARAGLLGAGLLGAGLLAGCAGEAATAPDEPPPATSLPPATPLSPGAPLPLPQPQPSTGPDHPEPGLGAEDRALLAEAGRIQAPWVVLLVAPEPGRTDEAVAGLTELGGVFSTSEPGAGLLRLTMPTGNVEQAAALPSVAAVDVEQVVPPGDSHPTG